MLGLPAREQDARGGKWLRDPGQHCRDSASGVFHAGEVTNTSKLWAFCGVRIARREQNGGFLTGVSNENSGHPRQHELSGRGFRMKGSAGFI